MTALTRREPGRLRSFFGRTPFASLREEMQDLFSQVLGENGESCPVDRLLPEVDVSESEQAVEVRMDLPGVKSEEINVEVSNNLLTVSGERKEEKEEKGKTFYRIERRTGSFSRSVMLPCSVQENKVDAKYQNGVLSISLPKTEEAKAHKIKVKA